MKKLIFSLSTILCALILFVSVGFVTGNDSVSAATVSSEFGTISDNETKTVTVNGVSGSGLFTNAMYLHKFTITEAGELTMTLNHDLISSTNTYFSLLILNEDQSTQVVAPPSSVTFNPFLTSKGNETVKSTDGIFLEPGTYYVRVYILQTGTYNYSVKLNFNACTDIETENNYDFSHADVIDTNKDYRAKLQNQSDDDWFKFTLPEDGYINIDFSHAITDSTKNGWRMYLLQEDATTSFLGDVNTSVTKSWVFAANKQKGTVSGVGLKAGTYYLRIEAVEYFDIVYTLRINYTATPYSENESNQSYLDANEIELNKSYVGAVSSSNDRDWFEFTTEEDGYFSVKFEHGASATSNYAWLIYLFHADGTSYMCDESNYYPVNGTVATTYTPKIGVKAGTYLVRIESNDSDFYDTPYHMTVEFEAASDWEKESNHSSTLASNMGSLLTWYGTASGSSYNKKDSDWYKFRLNYYANYSITISHDKTGSSSTNVYNVYLYKDIDTSSPIKSFTVKGNADATVDLGALYGGNYYLRIYSAALYNSVYKVEFTDDHEHNYSTTGGVATSDSYHTQNCTKCGKEATFAHNWTPSRVITPETCTEDGEKLLKCTVCNAEKTDVIPAAHKKTTIKGVAATCLEPGYTDKIYCTVCNEVFSESTPINALGHSLGDWQYETKLTCTEGANRYKRCYRCSGKFEEGFVEATGHNYVDYVTEPTCTKKGHTLKYCTKCYDQFETDFVDPTGHDYNVLEYVEPKCDKTGSRRSVCKVCSYINRETLPALGHTDELIDTQPLSCTSSHMEFYKCSTCNSESFKVLEQPTGHSFGEPVTVNNKVIVTCSKCGLDDVIDVIPEPDPTPTEDDKDGPGAAVILIAVGVGAAGVGGGVYFFKKKKH